MPGTSLCRIQVLVRGGRQQDRWRRVLFLLLAALHTAGHLGRWAARGEGGAQLATAVGVSGGLALLLLVLIIAPMAVPSARLRFFTCSVPSAFLRSPSSRTASGEYRISCRGHSRN